jgi:thiamine-phosphate pyrophosphorylase
MLSLERLVDACRNRAAEGLRTLEDLARFTRDDHAMSAAFKALRHDLATAVKRCWAEERLLAARDTASDVGTSIEVDGETHRASTADIARAAAGRACEGLRSLEEAAKTIHPPTAHKLEQLRYLAYDLSAALIRQLASAQAKQWRVCLLLDRGGCMLPWAEVLRCAIDKGVDCVQIREESTGSDDAALLEHAAAVVDIAHARGVSVIVNDRTDIAHASGADGVHLGQHDLPVQAARDLLGHEALVGVSVHGVDEAHVAIAAGADYVGIGPMFASTTKPNLKPRGPLMLVETLAVLGSTPHLAIGGITGATVHQVAMAGGRGVAVGAAMCTSSDPGAVAAALVEALEPVGVS